MANFCNKCGAKLGTDDLCPNCDRERIEAAVAQAMADTNESRSFGKSTPETGSLGNNDQQKADVVKNKPKKSRPKALVTVITVLLSVVLFLTSLLTVVIYDVRNVLKSENMERLLENVQVTDLLGNIPASAKGDMDRFYDYMKSNHGIEVTDNRLDRFVNRSTVKKFVANKASGFCEDFFEGDARLKITKREIENLLQKNTNVIKDVFDVSLKDPAPQNIAHWIFNNEEKDEVVIIDTETIEDGALVCSLLRKGLSYITMTIFILLSVLIIFFMIRNSWSQAACGIGIVFVIAGGLGSLMAMLSAWITPLWEILCGHSVVGIIMGSFMVINALASIILLVLGIVLIVVRWLVMKYYIKKKGK